MAFVSGLLGTAGGMNGTGISGPSSANIINPSTQNQADSAFNNTQEGVNQQMAFLHALQAQNGIGNQSSVFGQLQGVANGTGPNPAQAMLAQATGANVANQAALMAGQRGSGANAGMIARQAAMAGSNAQQQAAGQAAGLQANQSLNALGQMGAIAGQQVASQAGAVQGFNQAAQGQQQNILNSIAQQNNANVGMQSNINSANAGLIQNTMAGQQEMLGNVMSGVGTAMTGMSGGGAKGGGLAGGGNPADIAKFAAVAARGGAVNNLPVVALNGGGQVPALVSPGEVYLDPNDVSKVKAGADPIKTGDKIPGKAAVKGDSLKNDTVPATLEEGGIVIPRSVVNSKNPGAEAKKFVENALAESKKNFADGGQVEGSRGTSRLDALNQLNPFANVDFSGVKEALTAPVDPTAAARGAMSVSGMGSAPPPGAPPRTEAPVEETLVAEPSIAPVATEEGGVDASIAPPQATGMPGDETQGMMRAGYNEGIKGIRTEAAAKAELADRQAALLEKSAMDQDEALQVYQKRAQEIDAKVAAARQAVEEGAIDPNKFWNGDKNGNGGHSRIMAGIGMIIAGFNPTTGENMAVKFLNQQMEQNLQAQAKNLQSKETLLGTYLQEYGNLKDATTMTMGMQKSILATQIEKEAAKAANPLAQAAGMQAAAKFKMQAAEDFAKVTKSRGLGDVEGMVNADPSKLGGVLSALSQIDPAKAKDFRERSIPGLGIASTVEGAKGLRTMQVMVKDVNADVTRMREILQTGGKSLSPVLRNEAHGIQKRLMGKIRESVVGPGTLSESDKADLLSVVPNVAAMTAWDEASARALDNLEKAVSRTYRNTAAANGINVRPGALGSGLTPKQAEMVEAAKRNPKHPNSQAILKKFGQN